MFSSDTILPRLTALTISSAGAVSPGIHTDQNCAPQRAAKQQATRYHGEQ
jgi:hypothetical protein